MECKERLGLSCRSELEEKSEQARTFYKGAYRDGADIVLKF